MSKPISVLEQVTYVKNLMEEINDDFDVEDMSKEELVEFKRLLLTLSDKCSELKKVMERQTK